MNIKNFIFLSMLLLFSCSEQSDPQPSSCSGDLELTASIPKDRRTDLIILKDNILDTNSYVRSFSIYSTGESSDVGIVKVEKEDYCGSLITCYSGAVFNPIKVPFASLFERDTLYNVGEFNYTGTFSTKKVDGRAGYTILKAKIYSNTDKGHLRFTFEGVHVGVDLKMGSHNYTVLFETGKYYHNVLITGSTKDFSNFKIALLDLSLTNFAIEHKIGEIQL